MLLGNQGQNVPTDLGAEFMKMSRNLPGNVEGRPTVFREWWEGRCCPWGVVGGEKRRGGSRKQLSQPLTGPGWLPAPSTGGTQSLLCYCFTKTSIVLVEAEE